MRSVCVLPGARGAVQHDALRIAGEMHVEVEAAGAMPQLLAERDFPDTHARTSTRPGTRRPALSSTAMQVIEVIATRKLALPSWSACTAS